MHLAQELLTNVQCSGGFRSSAKELEDAQSLEDARSGWSSEVDNDQLRGSSKLEELDK